MRLSSNPNIHRFPSDTTSEPSLTQHYDLRLPRAADARAVHDLIAACPPLDRNSLYCNLLQCTHFAETCALAEHAGAIGGFVSGYLVPGRADVLFIWQVAVASSARGHGLGRRLIKSILRRPVCRAVDTLHTTITPRNLASWSMFRRLAADLGADIEASLLFESKRDFGGAHESEYQVSIGPFAHSL